MRAKTLTVADLAARWDIEADTIYAMVRRRLLIAFALGGETYVSREHVEYFEDNGMTDLRREHLVE
jgi:hypothetical protein